jgi:hypothetical protein
MLGAYAPTRNTRPDFDKFRRKLRRRLLLRECQLITCGQPPFEFIGGFNEAGDNRQQEIGPRRSSDEARSDHNRHPA